MIHDFRRSLDRSHEWADAPWWREVYDLMFPESMVQDMRKDGWWQRAGIDRRIHLSNGTTVTVDEKVREKDWPDFALEAFSHWDEDNESRRKPGWMEYAACDYLAYAFIPSRRCYLLPMRELQRIWHDCRSEWWALARAEQGGFKFADARNTSYVTRCICVPIPVVLDAIRDCLLCTWTKEAAA